MAIEADRLEELELIHSLAAMIGRPDVSELEPHLTQVAARLAEDVWSELEQHYFEIEHEKLLSVDVRPHVEASTERTACQLQDFADYLADSAAMAKQLRLSAH
jgi:hypothetical protein